MELFFVPSIGSPVECGCQRENVDVCVNFFDAGSAYVKIFVSNDVHRDVTHDAFSVNKPSTPTTTKKFSHRRRGIKILTQCQELHWASC